MDKLKPNMWPMEARLINEIRIEEVRQRYADRVRFDEMPGDAWPRFRWLERDLESHAPEIAKRAEDFLHKDKKKLAVEWMLRVVEAAERVIDIPGVPKWVESWMWRWLRNRAKRAVGRLL